MTWTVQGNFLTSVTGGLYNTSTTSITTGAAGNLIVCINTMHSDTGVYPSGMSSSRVTWAKVPGTDVQDLANTSANIAAPQTWSGNIWFGTVNSAGSDTVTFTWTSSTPAHVNCLLQEFASSAGSWHMDKWTYLNSSSGGSAWPAMTPAGPGELFAGFAWNASNASAPSPNPDANGYQYQVHGDGPVNMNGGSVNTSVPSGATGPVWADSLETYGIMVLVAEGTAPAGTAVVQAPRGSSPGPPPAGPGSRLVVPARASGMSAAAYAASYGIIAGGAGSWASPASAEGAPDGSCATWTAP